MKKKYRVVFNNFVKEARAIGFTDDQIDFLWDWLYMVAAAPEAILHDDNYKKVSK